MVPLHGLYKVQNGGDFTAPPSGGMFEWQHFARVCSQMANSLTLSLFDNNNQAADNCTAPSLGLELELPQPPSKSNPIRSIKRFNAPSHPVYTDSQGSYQPLKSAGGFIGYGQIALIREFSPSGDLRWQARFGANNIMQSYRAFKQEWHAVPCWKPNLVVKQRENGKQGSSEGKKGYVSWNGATDVQAWNVYFGDSSGEKVQLAGQVPLRGFETAFDVPSDVKYVAVGAVQDGKEIRRSELVG